MCSLPDVLDGTNSEDVAIRLVANIGMGLQRTKRSARPEQVNPNFFNGPITFWGSADA